ncbi:MAG: GAF domain-containing protein [Anaerolineales bacterium]|nr:GAF domain-containing protein [Anaerolineales bacterium]
MSTPLRLLLIEDNEDDSLLILRELKRNGYEVDHERIETAGQLLDALKRRPWDIILCDYSLPHFNAPQALALVQSTGSDLPFIIVSGTIGEESAVESLKAGAHDFIIKGNPARLATAVQRELRDAKVRQEHRHRERELEAIASISMTLRKTNTLKEMLSELLDQALDLIYSKTGSIWLYDKTSNTVNLSIQRGWDNLNITTSLRPGEDIPGLVVKTGERIITREFHSDPRVLPVNRERIPKGIGGACIPLYSEDEVVGVIFINVSLPREISTGEVNMLNALAEIGGNAIHRMYLLEQTLKQVEQLKGLRTIDLAISSSLDLRISLRVVLEQITSQLKVDAASVLLIKPELNRLEFSAGRGFRTNRINTTSLGLDEGYAGRVALEKKLVQVNDLKKNSERFARPKLIEEEAFVSYIGVPLIAKGMVQGVLEIFNRSPLNVDNDWLTFLDALSRQTAIAVDNALLFENLQRSNFDLASAYNATIEGWSRALDMRDKETEGHSLRVTELTLKLARIIGMQEQHMINVKRGALLHDIGKMGVPDSILLKPGPLTEDEWSIMRRHPQNAFDLLAPISYLRQALDIPYSHHEKWDGTGYPRGLKGEEIPLSARVFALVDVWDALTNDRPYRTAWPAEKALDYIRENSGIYFDPQIVNAFMSRFADLFENK